MHTAALRPSSAVRRMLLAAPVGPLLAEYDAAGVRALHVWEQGHHPPAGTRIEPTRDDVLGWALAAQLREYFAGSRWVFDLPLAAGGTAFQQRVWAALRQIPPGETRSYADVARMVGTGSARAVGQANRRNPLPIIVPCHRVVGASDALGGYMGSAGAGPETAMKQWLLEHEKRLQRAGACWG